MKRILWMFLLVFLFSINGEVYAQNATEMPNLTLRCVNATNISATKSQHFVKLDGVGFTPNQPIEIWRDSQEGFVCAIDSQGQSLCGSSALSAKDNGKEFQILSATLDQVVADGNGEIHIAKVRTRTKDRLQHNFYGAQKTPATGQTTVLPELNSSDYGLKLLTFLNETAQTSPSELTNCTTVFFDPYGRVFDSVSLEPITNSTVWLQDNNKTAIPNQPGVTNPNITTADGGFSFFVADGTYYLNPKAENYLFPISESELNRLISDQTIYYELYRGEPIIQQGEIQHRDIPMSPQDPNLATNNPPIIMDKQIKKFATKEGSFQQISGVVSHPQSIVNVYSSSRLVGTTSADTKGVFTLTISNKEIDQTLPLDIVAEKIPLNKITSSSNRTNFFSKLIKVVSAEQSTISQTVSVFPSPNFLIGFVYNKDFKIAPFSTVDIIVPKMENRVYASLKSDINGFILIPESSLPPVEYELRVKTGQGQIINTQTANEFITVNKKFLAEEKINLLSPEPDNLERVVKNIEANGTKYTQKYSLPTPTVAPIASKEDTKTLPIYILLTIVVVGSIAVLIIQLNKFKASKYNNQDKF